MISRVGVVAIVLCAAMAAIGAGCAEVSSPATLMTPATTGQAAAGKDDPRVQNCAVVSIGSPSKYACGGKVYTTFQLAKMREEAKQKYESGQ